MSLKKNIVSHLIKLNHSLGHNIFNKPGRPSGSRPNALAVITCILKHATVLNDQEILQNDVVTDSGGDGGIDAVHFDLQNRKILIYDVKGGKSGFGERDINDFIRTIKNNVMDEPVQSQGLNPLINRKLAQARDYYLDHDWKIKLIFARPLHDHCLKGREPRMLNYFLAEYAGDVDHECLCFTHFISLLTNREQENSRHFDLKFDSANVITANLPKRVQNKPSVVIGTLRLSDLVRMRHDLGEGVFDDNIRLDHEDNNLSEGILHTLKNNPQDFYLYHNGFTISCNDIKRRGPRVFKLIDPQVINGCQSLSALYRSQRSFTQQLSKATALCRVYGYNSRQFIEAICQSTNTQKKIESWDLRTNDEIIKIIDIFLSEYGFVRRKKGKSREGFLLPTLTQWIYSCKYQQPSFAKNNKKDLFDVFEGDKSLYHKEIYNDKKLKIIQLKRIVEIGLLVNRKIRQERRIEIKGMLKYADFHIMTALYKMKDYRGQGYTRVINALKIIVRSQQQILGEGFSYTKIFAKSNEVWLLLKQRLRI